MHENDQQQLRRHLLLQSLETVATDLSSLVWLVLSGLFFSFAPESTALVSILLNVQNQVREKVFLKRVVLPGWSSAFDLQLQLSFRVNVPFQSIVTGFFRPATYVNRFLFRTWLFKEEVRNPDADGRNRLRLITTCNTYYKLQFNVPSLKAIVKSGRYNSLTVSKKQCKTCSKEDPRWTDFKNTSNRLQNSLKLCS